MLTVIEIFELANANCRTGDIMNLFTAEIGKEYIIKDILTNDDEIDSFLFSLGCYSGEPITVISRRRKSCFVSIIFSTLVPFFR